MNAECSSSTAARRGRLSKQNKTKQNKTHECQEKAVGPSAAHVRLRSAALRAEGRTGQSPRLGSNDVSYRCCGLRLLQLCRAELQQPRASTSAPPRVARGGTSTQRVHSPPPLIEDQSSPEQPHDHIFSLGARPPLCSPLRRTGPIMSRRRGRSGRIRAHSIHQHSP